MTNYQEWFNKGLSKYDYISKMSVNKENLLSVYNSFTADDTDVLHNLQNKELKAMILTADWCGDAMVNVPIFLKLADEALIETKFLIRDENLELMDQFLTNGVARSIPIIIFLDKDYHYVGKWGPRAANIQEEVDQLKASLPSKESEDYDAAFKLFIKELVSKFTTNEEWWKIIKEDLLKSMVEFR